MTNLTKKQSQYFRITHESTSNTFHIAQIDEEGEQQDSMRIDYDEIIDLINLLTEFTKFH